jgi:3-methyladenine DNA glycosylase AlkD
MAGGDGNVNDEQCKRRTEKYGEAWKELETVTAAEKERVAGLCREIESRLSELPALDAKNVRALRREVSQRISDLPSDVVLSLAVRLTRLNHVLAYELVYFHGPLLRSLRAADVELLGKNMDSWGAVDCFAYYVAGPVWRARRIEDRVVHGWAASPSPWWRRAALVSTVPLNNKARGGVGDTGRTIDVCRLLIADREKVVVKAMSWALRQLSKCDREAVASFVKENESTLVAIVKREVNNKLLTGRKVSRVHEPGKVRQDDRQRKPR